MVLNNATKTTDIQALLEDVYQSIKNDDYAAFNNCLSLPHINDAFCSEPDNKALRLACTHKRASFVQSLTKNHIIAKKEETFLRSPMTARADCIMDEPYPLIAAIVSSDSETIAALFNSEVYQGIKDDSDARKHIFKTVWCLCSFMHQSIKTVSIMQALGIDMNKQEWDAILSDPVSFWAIDLIDYILDLDDSERGRFLLSVNRDKLKKACRAYDFTGAYPKIKKIRKMLDSLCNKEVA